KRAMTPIYPLPSFKRNSNPQPTSATGSPRATSKIPSQTVLIPDHLISNTPAGFANLGDLAWAPRLFRNDLSGRCREWWQNHRPPAGDPAPDSEGRSQPGWGEMLRGGFSQLWQGIEVSLGLTNSPSPNPDPAPTLDDALAQYVTFEKLPPPERQILWAQAVEQLRASGCPCPSRYTGSYEDYRAGLAELGDRLPYRIQSLRCGLTLLHHRETVLSEAIERPIAVVIGAAADHNGAFSANGGYPLLDQFVGSGRFHVLYFEASDESQLREY